MNDNKPTFKFEIAFFLFAAILLALIGIRFGGLTPLNIGICVVLLILAPILTKILGKKYGTEAAVQNKMEKIDAISEEDLTARIKALYTGRGFALEHYESEFPGSHYVCVREGTRNGEAFSERGAVLVICTDKIIHIEDFDNFRLEMKQRGCTQGMIITTSRFSPEVIDAAKDALITLWNRESLRDNLNI
ncbi:MAG: restriction endonuclease [Catonella sp.]|uniref:restriction endonuclease n=1 Tax=Catonella sp. TaxID=2382125 RepID=UPI003FA0ACFD